MSLTKLKFKPTPSKRRGVAEVISTLLLVVITVIGAVILTSFIDESFVAGSQSVISGKDTTIKTIKLVAYDTRDGTDLMGNTSLDNNHLSNPKLCRASCNLDSNTNPDNGGSEFLVIQIENRSVEPVFLKNLYLDNVNHEFDQLTVNVDLDGSSLTSTGGVYPEDGKFSILPEDMTVTPTQLDNQINGGSTVNILVKLDSDLATPDIELSKTMRVQLNIGDNSLAEFLIETGDTR